jgi:hypothetical protein
MDLPRRCLFEIFAMIKNKFMCSHVRFAFAFGSPHDRFANDNDVLFAIANDDVRLFQKFPDSGYDYLCYAIIHNSVKCIEYIKTTNYTCGKSALNATVKYGNFEMYKFIHHNRTKLWCKPYYAVEKIIKYGRIEYLRFLIDDLGGLLELLDYGSKYLFCDILIKYNRFEFLEILIQNNYLINTEVLNELAKRNDLKNIKLVIKYIENENPIGYGYVDILRAKNTTMKYYPDNVDMLIYLAGLLPK